MNKHRDKEGGDIVPQILGETFEKDDLGGREKGRVSLCDCACVYLGIIFLPL